jgi:hypothetical protein
MGVPHDAFSTQSSNAMPQETVDFRSLTDGDFPLPTRRVVPCFSMILCTAARGETSIYNNSTTPP